MKALTLHQPYASAIALGIKTVETRSWRTSYRGPLAIHAGRARPTVVRVGCWELSEYPDVPQWVMSRDADAWHVEIQPLPLSAVVATCRLVDVVPITDPADEHRWGGQQHLIASPPDIGLRIATPSSHSAHGWKLTHVEDQRPWGDFTPGRWAWLLDDVKPTTERCPACWDAATDGPGPGLQWDETACGDPDHCDPVATCRHCAGTLGCDPVPARGRQGLWEWTP